MKLTRIILLAGVLLCSVYIRLQAQYFGGSGDGYASATSGEVVLAIENIIVFASVTEKFKLYQNYPNPFNPTTTIHYYLPKTSDVILTVYNAIGREVRSLINDNQIAGEKSVVWDGKDQFGLPVSSGVYIYRLETADYAKSKKMVLMK